MAKKTTVKRLQPGDISNKQDALNTALSDIEKNFGKGAIMKLGERANKMNIQVIPTSCLEIDVALGVGGLPRGRIVEIYGPEASGKTTIALHCVASAQKMGGIAAYIDAEHALDPVYAKALGVNIDEMYISQPDNGEQALDICEALVRSGAVDIIVIDSVAALVPKAEIEGLMGDNHVGLQARLMSQALRKLAGLLSRSDGICLFINQLRDKVGISYGSPETTTGGKALKFYASVRLDIRRGEQIKSGNDVVGNRTKVRVVKNKVAPPFKLAEFDILYGEGVSHVGSLIDNALEHKLISKSGTWFSYGDLRLGQGKENARVYLKEHAELQEEINEKLRVLMLEEDDEQPAAPKAKGKTKAASASVAADDTGDADDTDGDDDLTEEFTEEDLEFLGEDDEEI